MPLLEPSSPNLIHISGIAIEIAGNTQDFWPRWYKGSISDAVDNYENSLVLSGDPRRLHGYPEEKEK